jgi:hypothetical protein
LRQYVVFEGVHGLKIAGGSIVVAEQVQHAVDRVKQQFEAHRDSMLLRQPTRPRNRDNHLARCDAPKRILVNRESEHIRGTVDSHEFRVEGAHLSVVDERER